MKTMIRVAVDAAGWILLVAMFAGAMAVFYASICTDRGTPGGRESLFNGCVQSIEHLGDPWHLRR